MTDARSRILERRARFVAAAMTLGAASGVAACEPQVCLEMAVDCDADVPTLLVDGPSSLCVGEQASFTATTSGSCGGETVTSRAVFATSDPALLVFEGSRARALGVGSVVVTALFDGKKATTTVQLVECADASAPKDVGTDADSSAATDADAD